MARTDTGLGIDRVQCELTEQVPVKVSGRPLWNPLFSGAQASGSRHNQHLIVAALATPPRTRAVQNHGRPVVFGEPE